MTNKTKKDLQVENSELRNDLSEIKVYYDNLSENFKSLELQLKGSQEVKNNYFPCKNCETYSQL